MSNASSPYWILVADSGNARILEIKRTPAEIRMVHKLTSETLHMRSGDLKSDASGRSFHVQGPSSHSKKPRSDAHDQAEKEFSRILVAKLELAAQHKSFERLLIAADPKTLGRLRQYMTKALTARVTDEWNVDLTGIPMAPLEKRLRARLGWPG